MDAGATEARENSRATLRRKEGRRDVDGGDESLKTGESGRRYEAEERSNSSTRRKFMFSFSNIQSAVQTFSPQFQSLKPNWMRWIDGLKISHFLKSRTHCLFVTMDH